jgi:hypothetical protein
MPIMLLRLCSLLASIAMFAAPAAHAADPAALAFVDGIYRQYRNSDAPGVDTGSEESLRRYFEPGLAALLLKDAEEANRKDEAPKLDGDPFVDAQDWRITDVKIALADTGKDRILATVNFNNFKQPKTVKLDLIKLGGAWKIYDIVWSETTLRKLLSSP